jgi:hypothetical protein
LTQNRNGDAEKWACTSRINSNDSKDAFIPVHHDLPGVFKVKQQFMGNSTTIDNRRELTLALKV